MTNKTILSLVSVMAFAVAVLIGTFGYAVNHAKASEVVVASSSASSFEVTYDAGDVVIIDQRNITYDGSSLTTFNLLKDSNIVQSFDSDIASSDRQVVVFFYTFVATTASTSTFTVSNTSGWQQGQFAWLSQVISPGGDTPSTPVNLDPLWITFAIWVWLFVFFSWVYLIKRFTD